VDLVATPLYVENATDAFLPLKGRASGGRKVEELPIFA